MSADQSPFHPEQNIVVRFQSSAERTALRQIAAGRGETVSSFVRRAVRARLIQELFGFDRRLKTE
jgi:hypothetical protein